jgi:hypothetical protein
MIKFFRKIRQRLLTENKFSKYLLYAIGEIILVVIGILIALQINNWNIYQNDRIKEKKILHELVVNLELNKKLILGRIDHMDALNKWADLLLNLQDKDFIKSDSLGKTFTYPTVLPTIFNLPNQGYENLKSEGFDIILNENLRSEIIQLFNVDYAVTNIRFSTVRDEHRHQFQYIDENFEWGHIDEDFKYGRDNEGQDVLHPNNMEKTLHDYYFFSIIKSFKHERSRLIYWLEEDLESTEKLLMLLKESGY